MGGALAAIDQGFIQGEIHEAAFRYQKAVENKEEILVGVNAFRIEEERELERLEVDPAIEEAQRSRLAAIRQPPDPTRTNQLLNRLERAALGTENLMPLFITSVENDITLGEICGVLRRRWGVYQPPAAV